MLDAALDPRWLTIAVSSSTGAVSFRIRDGITWIEIEGEPNGPQLVACLRGGMEQRRLQAPQPVLVDLTGFTGAVHWPSIWKIARLSRARAHAHGTRVAYVVRNPAFGMLVKATATRFPRSQHRCFPDHRSALAWLTADERVVPGA